MEKLDFREANYNDIEMIIEIAQKAWKPTYAAINSYEQNEYMFDIWYSANGLKKQMQEGQVFWLISYNKINIGYAAYSKLENNLYKLNKIYILPNYKGKGLGKKFISFIENTLIKIGAKALQLNVNRNNTATKFYEACGYKIIRKEDIPFDNFWMNDFVMEKKL